MSENQRIPINKVNLDGDAILFRVFIDGLYQDRIFVRDDLHPRDSNCFRQVRHGRAFEEQFELIESNEQKENP